MLWSASLSGLVLGVMVGDDAGRQGFLLIIRAAGQFFRRVDVDCPIYSNLRKASKKILVKDFMGTRANYSFVTAEINRFDAIKCHHEPR